MGISAFVTDAADLTRFVAQGEITFVEHIAAIRSFYEEMPTRNVVWDVRLMEGTRLTAEELRALVTLAKSYTAKRPRGKTALVASFDIDYGLARMIQAFAISESLPWEIEVFRSLPDALGWFDESAQLVSCGSELDMEKPK